MISEDKVPIEIEKIESRLKMAKKLKEKGDCAAGIRAYVMDVEPLISAYLAVKQELDTAKEDIEALLHKGRQGELEQANVGMADIIRKQDEQIKYYKSALEKIADPEANGMPRVIWNDIASLVLNKCGEK